MAYNSHQDSIEMACHGRIGRYGFLLILVGKEGN